MELKLLDYAIPVFFILIGLEIIVGRVQGQKFYRLNDSIADLALGTVSQIVGILIKLVTLAGYFFIYENFRIVQEMSYASIPLWILCFLCQDFCYYWAHRLSHEVNILWASHSVHHQSEEFNLTVALRQSSFQGLVTNWVYWPMALVGFPPWMFLGVGQINLIYQFWIHTRAVKKMGFFEILFNTPSHHRVHHGINPQYIDRNHAGTLIIWDKLFGTFEPEEEEVVYGVVSPLKSFNPFWSNFHYYKDLYALAKQADKFTDKIKVWFKAPGWVPQINGVPAHQKEVPKVNPATFQRYDVPMSKGLATYVLFWFVAIVAGSFYYMVVSPKLGWTDLSIFGAYSLLSLLSLCAFMEKKSWGVYAEIFRLTTFAVGVFVLFDFEPHFAVISSAIAAVGGLLWVFTLRNNGGLVEAS